MQTGPQSIRLARGGLSDKEVICGFTARQQQTNITNTEIRKIEKKTVFVIYFRNFVFRFHSCLHLLLYTSADRCLVTGTSPYDFLLPLQQHITRYFVQVRAVVRPVCSALQMDTLDCVLKRPFVITLHVLQHCKQKESPGEMSRHFNSTGPRHIGSLFENTWNTWT
jgi:hypothetical protein